MMTEYSEGMKELQNRAKIELESQKQLIDAGELKLHKKRCDTCSKKGTHHEAIFNDLPDEDGSPLLNLVTPDTLVAQIWVNVHGCKNWKPSFNRIDG